MRSRHRYVAQTKTCPTCGTVFREKHGAPQTYCSIPCANVPKKSRNPKSLEITDNEKLLAMVEEVAVTWTIRRIADGQVWRVRNLGRWCRENTALFVPHTWREVYSGLSTTRYHNRKHAHKYAESYSWNGFTIDD